MPHHLLELEGDELEALLLEALDNLADQLAVDAIGLDHDVGLFIGHVCFDGGGLCRGWEHAGARASVRSTRAILFHRITR